MSDKAEKMKRDLRYAGRWTLFYLVALPLAFCTAADNAAKDQPEVTSARKESN